MSVAGQQRALVLEVIRRLIFHPITQLQLRGRKNRVEHWLLNSFPWKWHALLLCQSKSRSQRRWEVWSYHLPRKLRAGIFAVQHQWLPHLLSEHHESNYVKRKQGDKVEIARAKLQQWVEGDEGSKRQIKCWGNSEESKVTSGTNGKATINSYYLPGTIWHIWEMVPPN